jgi:hypothetical protein
VANAFGSRRNLGDINTASLDANEDASLLQHEDGTLDRRDSDGVERGELRVTRDPGSGRVLAGIDAG